MEGEGEGIGGFEEEDWFWGMGSMGLVGCMGFGDDDALSAIVTLGFWGLQGQGFGGDGRIERNKEP